MNERYRIEYCGPSNFGNEWSTIDYPENTTEAKVRAAVPHILCSHDTDKVRLMVSADGKLWQPVTTWWKTVKVMHHAVTIQQHGGAR